MESIRPFFHGIASAIQLLGLAITVLGALRVARAPALAMRRASGTQRGRAANHGEAAARDLPDASAERERYARGLTDFYRVSGAVAVLAGIVLVLVPVFAG